MVFWKYLWPTLCCRRVAGVSPLLSIGWWYLSSVSPKRYCCRVSVADKGCRVYPLDSRPDAVVLYSGCTPGKRRACYFCQMTGTLPPLLDSVVGGGTPGRRCLRVYMDPMLLCPGKGLVLPTFTVDQVAAHSRFLLISLPNKEMSIKSPFAIHKALFGIGGEPKSIKRLRGVISEPDLLSTPESEILEGFSDQGVIQVRRITIKKDSNIIPTKHLILTFNSPKLPATIKAGYLNCKIRAYVSSPLRCFKCQSLEQKCVNCSQPHSSDSKQCPEWKAEKEIQAIKTNRNISYLEARKLIAPQLS
ncbi:putative RNA-directed DNA polymerase from transposon BS [Trichonephila clavipes]|nr:putative RNA-directed DNA polymerase from transposon BS [Trichonephila clavipes]